MLGFQMHGKCSEYHGTLIDSSPLLFIQFPSIVLPRRLMASVSWTPMFRTRVFTIFLLYFKFKLFFYPKEIHTFVYLRMCF